MSVTLVMWLETLLPRDTSVMCSGVSDQPEQLLGLYWRLIRGIVRRNEQGRQQKKRKVQQQKSWLKVSALMAGEVNK